MHFSVFDSCPSAPFFSASILSDRTSRPTVYQLIARSSWVPLWANGIFFSFFGVTKWVMHVCRELPVREGSNYSQLKFRPDLWVLWQPRCDASNATAAANATANASADTFALQDIGNLHWPNTARVSSVRSFSCWEVSQLINVTVAFTVTLLLLSHTQTHVRASTTWSCFSFALSLSLVVYQSKESSFV